MDYNFLKFWNLMNQIMMESIDAGIWCLYDLEDGFWSHKFFGTLEAEFITGKVVCIWIKDSDTFNWLKPKTADYILKVAEDENLHIWKIE